MANADIEMRWNKDQCEGWHHSHSAERQTKYNCVE